MYAKANIVVVYYGGADLRGCRLALAVAEGVWNAGARVRVRCVQRLVLRDGARFTPEWADVLRETEGVTETTADDLTWADAVLYGRFAKAGVAAPTATELAAAREEGRRAAEEACALKVTRAPLPAVA